MFCRRPVWFSVMPSGPWSLTVSCVLTACVCWSRSVECQGRALKSPTVVVGLSVSPLFCQFLSSVFFVISHIHICGCAVFLRVISVTTNVLRLLEPLSDEYCRHCSLAWLTAAAQALGRRSLCFSVCLCLYAESESLTGSVSFSLVFYPPCSSQPCNWNVQNSLS